MKQCGIDIDFEKAKEKVFKISFDRKRLEKNDFTDFQKGKIAIEDVCFLPENTYGILKQNNKKDVLCKTVHLKPLTRESSSLFYSTYLVKPFFDKGKNDNEYFVSESWRIIRCCKNIHSHDKSDDKNYFQIVKIETEDLKQWQPVRIKNCQGGLYWYQDGWKYCDGTIYKSKDINSEKLSLMHKVGIKEIQETEFHSEIERVKPEVLLVPGEKTHYFICFLLYIATFLLNGFWIIWIAITIYMFNKRKELRNKYWL